MELKISKKVITPLNKWLEKNGFATTCETIKKRMCYQPEEDIIYFPRKFDERGESLFIQCLRDLGLRYDFDNITLSFLHELGHAQTAPLFTTKEWNSFIKVKESQSITLDEDDDRFYLDYWELKDELAANTWAVLYANCFPEKVQKLEDIIGQYIKFG